MLETIIDKPHPILHMVDIRKSKRTRTSVESEETQTFNYSNRRFRDSGYQEFKICHNVPEHALLEAVIERAVADMKSSKLHIRRGAMKWFLSPRTYTFTFLWCCIELGISPSNIRKFRAFAQAKLDADDITSP